MSGEDDLEGGKRSYHHHSHEQIHYLEGSFKKWSCPDDKQCEEISTHIGLETKQVKNWFQNKGARVKAMDDVLYQEDDLGNKQQSGEDDDLRNKQPEESKFQSKKRLYHRYSQEQIHYLEESFKKCPCPDENQRREISNIIGIEPGKVKYWFKNKRARVKAKTTLNVVAPSVRKFSTYVSPSLPPPISACATSILDENDVYESHHHQQPSSTTDHHETDKNIETTRMLETIVIAMTELFELLEENEPLWIKSPTDGSKILDHRIYDKKFLNTVISSDRTTTTGGGGGGARTESSKESVVVPKPPAQLMETVSNDTTGGGEGEGEGEREREGKGRAGTESSKESAIVPMSPAQLMEMFSDSEKWMNFFPTIVVESQKIKTIDIENLAGSLNLIYAKFHTLSPLVVPREYIFLRYCRQINSSIWVVLDTSYNSSLQDASSPSSWKFPSGCEIQKMLDEKSSMVTWIEHVKVDESLFTDVLFDDVIGNCEAFGAKRWLVNLQWMCEKFAFYETPQAVILSRLERDARTRRTLMNLSHNMVKNFCEILSAPKTKEVGYSNDDMMFRDFQISVHENTGTNHPYGTMLCVCTSLWLPIFYKHLFAFFTDVKTRSQWDVIRGKSSSRDTECVATGAHPGNCITWMKPSVMEGSAETILQESCLDSLGGLVIYTPIYAEVIKDAINGVDISMTAILPSGFVISGDGRHQYRSSKGSILTIVFQILVAEIPSSTELGSGDAMDYVRALMDATITKIKANTTHLIGIPPQ